MARSYRFFLRHVTDEVLPVKAERPFNLYENLEPGIFFQLVKVLRVKNGDEVVLLPALQTPPYFEYKYSVESADKKAVTLRFMGKTQNTNESQVPVSLLLCLPNKPDKLELILQKAVELGANRIVLLESDLSQMKHSLRADRLEKIVVEAAEQSERAVIPEIVIAGKLKKYFDGLSGEEMKNVFVALERDGGGVKRGSATPSFWQKSADVRESADARKPAEISILIGPEGGFSDEEKKLIFGMGLTCFSLGKRILRMETAAILSLGLAILSFNNLVEKPAH